jgi:hypothetical protein
MLFSFFLAFSFGFIWKDLRSMWEFPVKTCDVKVVAWFTPLMSLIIITQRDLDRLVPVFAPMAFLFFFLNFFTCFLRSTRWMYMT